MKQRSKNATNVAKFQSPRPFSLYLSTYSPKLGRHAEENTGRSRSKSPNFRSATTRKSKDGRKSLDIACHGCIPQSDFSQKLDVTISSPPYHKCQTIQLSSEEYRRQAIMPVGPSTATWRFPKQCNNVMLQHIAYGLTMNKHGDMIVTMDLPKMGGFVQGYDKQGNQTFGFPLRPALKASKRFTPFQICEMPDGNLVVASSNCVTVWTKQGKLVAEHGKNMFKFCKNVAVRSSGELVVTDSDDSGMLKLISANGQSITKIDTDITCPAGVAVDSEDNIIVADWRHTIRMYDKDNELIRSFGVKGSRDGELDMPYGLFVDCDDNIVIADMWNHRVSVYDCEGKFINHIATQTANGIHRPQYVSIMADPHTDEYRLAVLEFWSNTVRVMNY